MHVVPVSIVAQQAITVTNERGDRFQIGPGAIAGHLGLGPYVDEALQATPDMALTEVLFDFRSEAGAGYRYRSVLHPGHLWIPEGELVERELPEFKPTFTLPTRLFDHREPFTVQYADGETIEGFFKYVGVKYEVMVADHPWMRTTFFSTAKGSDVTVHYKLRPETLLWKKAPRRGIDEFLLEEGRHVDIRETTVSRDVPESAIRVTAGGG